jgi:ubiquinone/menaquinone biosynthesis C-methylase UbiE
MGSYAQLFAHAPQHYAQYRPSYPAALIEAVLDFAGASSIDAAKDLAVDVATGSGQAAVPLAAVYRRVLAIDGSPEQLEQAQAKDNIEYCVGDAHAIPVPDHSTDLMTVAQALHW